MGIESLIDIAQAPLLIGLSGDGDLPDLVALVLGADRKVRHDADFVFYNNPHTTDAAVVLERRRHGTEQIQVDLTAIDASVHRVLFGCAKGSLEAGQRHDLTLLVADRDGTVVGTARCLAAATYRAMTLFEIYRHQDQWRCRLVADGYAAGLAGLVADYGVSAEKWKPPETWLAR